MSDIFISYSRKDSEQAKMLAERLRASGADVWMDSTALAAAETWSAEIVSAIISCRLFIVLLSADSVQSHNVNKEVSIASEKHKTIIPIVIEKCPLSQAMEYALAGLQRVKISDEEGLERAFAKLGISGSGLSQVVPSKKNPHAGSEKKSRTKVYSFASVFLILAIGSYFFFFSKKKVEASETKTIAVLPFESLSSEKESEYFADGMTAELIDMLAPIQEMHVVDRMSSMEYKEIGRDSKQVASELGVR